MSASLTASNTWTFADANAGHTLDFGTPPNPGDVDILLMQAVTVIQAPTSTGGATWTKRADLLTNQAAVVYDRSASGGEGSTVTITTNGDFNTTVHWQRWSGLTGFDTAGTAQVDDVSGTSAPTATTPALAGSGEVAVALSANTSTGAGNQTAPVWSAGLTLGTTQRVGTLTFGCWSFVGWRADAGPGTTSASATWTGDPCGNRYTIIVAYTATSGPIEGAAALTATASLTATAGNTVPAATALTANPTLTATAANTVPAAATLTSTAVLAATAANTVPATADLTAGAVLTAAADVIPLTGSATLTATPTLTATGVITIPGAATLTATARLTATGLTHYVDMVTRLRMVPGRWDTTLVRPVGG